MKILIYLHHPAQYHLFKNAMKQFEQDGHEVIVFATQKDILTSLLDAHKISYINNLPHGRKDNKLSMAWSVIKQDFGLLKHCLNNRPDIMVGTSAEICHIGFLLRIQSLMFSEDDAEVVPLTAKISYPFAKHIFAPEVCSVGKWINKKISYSSYHELAYLHPNNFQPSVDQIEKFIDINKPFIIIRLAKLTAHHDQGVSGINSKIAKEVIRIVEKKMNIYITSERDLEPQFEKYRINLPPLKIHHALAFASLYLGDSQTMAAESGVLGTPFIRCNDFVGRIGYLNELENKYKLGFGFKTFQFKEMLEKLNELVHTENLKSLWKERKDKMLSEKIDVTAFIVWFVENYPQSAKIMKENPDYQNRFK